MVKQLIHKMIDQSILILTKQHICNKFLKSRMNKCNLDIIIEIANKAKKSYDSSK